jgi:GTP cyclohydrolase I
MRKRDEHSVGSVIPIVKNDLGIEEEDFEEFIKELEHEEMPMTSKAGHLLFDANGNMPLKKSELREMIPQLEEKFIEIMDILRISRNDPNSYQTPKRIAKMLVNELLEGRFKDAPKSTVFPNRKQVDELIISKGIEVMSMCSHHWLPISGVAAVAYIPDKYVIGLSKMSRIVEWFSRRGQIQEELGEQIADYIENLIKPKALGVVIKAKHYCMIARGVRGSEDKATMVTSVMRGYLANDLNLRNEFLKLIE